MKRDRDIHKIDNHLIRWGWIVLVIGMSGTLLGLGTTEYRLDRAGRQVEYVSHNDDAATVRRRYPDADVTPVGGGPDGKWLWMLAASTLMLVCGYYVRRQENRALTVWGILEHAIEVRAVDLCTSTGLSRDELRKVLAVVNAQPGAFYVWDGASDTIVDGRLRKRSVHVDKCSTCGATVSTTMTLELAEAPACTYCGGPVTTGEQIRRMREETLGSIRDAPASGKPFSLWIFLLLLLFFWPLAIAYAMWKGGVLDPLIDKLGGGEQRTSRG